MLYFFCLSVDGSKRDKSNDFTKTTERMFILLIYLKKKAFSVNGKDYMF